MTNSDFIQLVAAVDLKRFAIPVRISCERAIWNDSLIVLVTLIVPDVITGEQTTVNHQEEFLPEHIKRLDRDGALMLIRRQLSFALNHELDECFLVDGKQLRDPHEREKRAT